MDIDEKVMAETDNFSVIVWRDPEGEYIYDINMDQVTLHLIKEDYDEFLKLVAQLK